MKLTKDTRNLVKIGTVLESSNGKQYTVTNMWGSTGINITVKCPDGRYIYGDRLSNWYGMKIVKTEE